jgi:hypothetical protein
VAAATSVVSPLAPAARPSTANVCVRVAQAEAGLSFTTTEERSWSAPSDTVSVAGYALAPDSQ